MSAERTAQISQISDEDLKKALVLLHQLSNEAIVQINVLMERLNLRFSEAALRSGAVSRSDLEKAMQWVRKHAMLQGRGIVENALRRAITVREVDKGRAAELTPSTALLIANDADHPRGEAIRRLRTELLLRTRNRRGSGAFAVLSPCAGEGRSQLAAELAISFALLGRRTLLIDADLRKPRQHRLFTGSENDMGLVQVLADGGLVSPYGITGVPQMSLLVSGGQPSNPTELLSRTQFEQVLAELRRSFEFIVVDTPPTSEFSDALAVATAVGSTLLVGRAERTSFSALTEMCRNLEPTNALILGAIINTF